LGFLVWKQTTSGNPDWNRLCFSILCPLRKEFDKTWLTAKLFSANSSTFDWCSQGPILRKIESTCSDRCYLFDNFRRKIGRFLFQILLICKIWIIRLAFKKNAYYDIGHRPKSRFYETVSSEIYR
jgi:hypothetical protein